MATREISTEITLEGEADFNREMAAVNSNLSALRAELAANKAEFADAADSQAALTSRSRLLTDAIDQQNAKLNALQSMLEAVEADENASTKTIDKYRREVANATGALARMEDELEDLERAGRQAEPALRGLTTVGRGFGVAVGGMAAAGAAASAGIFAVGAAAGVGVLALSRMAKTAAEEGNPAFAGLAANLETLSSASDGAKAALAQILLPSLEELSGKGGALLQDFTRDLEAAAGDTGATSSVIAQYVRRGAQLLADAVPDMLAHGQAFVGAVGQGALDSLPILMDAAGGVLDTLTQGILDNPDEIEATAAELVTSLVTFIGDHGPDLLTAGPVLLAAILQGITAGLGQMNAGGESVVAELLLSLLSQLPSLTSAGVELLLALIMGLVSAVPDLLTQVPDIIAQIFNAFVEGAVELVKLGPVIIDNILSGIFGQEVAFTQRLSTWIKGLVGKISGAAAADAVPSGGAAGRYATGLDYVPFDDFPAILHRGERVLTAAEARRYDGGSSTRVVNLTINAPHITPAEEQHIIDLVNRTFGGS